MPPVTITNVIPIARNAFSATCLGMRIRFAAERKFGAANEKKDENRDERDECPQPHEIERDRSRSRSWLRERRARHGHPKVSMAWVLRWP
jgi:hypothetical protein